MRARPRRLIVLLAPVVLALTACGDDGDDGGGGACAGRCADIAGAVESGETEGDGEQLFSVSCASCHGPQGQGGIGPQLAGVAERLTTSEHVSVVLDGRGNMPSFGTLDDDVIAAIVAYERAELSG
jgi:mono/diheme cytochrome c family protein